MTGYAREELIGQSVRIFYADDAEFQLVGAEKYRQIAENGTGTVETHWVTKDGRTLNILLSSTPFDPADLSVGITFIALDVTERKRAVEALRKSEEKFSEAFRISPTVLTISEPDTGRYLEVNDAFAKVFGYSRDEVIGKTSLELGVWLSSEERSALQQALQPAGELIGASARMRSKDGKVHDVSISAKLIRYEDRVDLLAIIEDVTEKKKLEAQLIQSQKMESVGRLAGGVAHDYNNMLAVIFFSIALIKNRLRADDPAMESVIEIERAATRSRDITRQLLAFSRKQLIAPKPCDLNILIADLEKSLARLIGEDIELRVSLQYGLGQVLIDPSQVDQILVNLAVNARDAMPAGGKITIETANSILDENYCATHDEYCLPGAYVRLTVCDNGSGMGKETLEHIFEPFFTTKEVGKGTGLGLATVFGIVKQNNGFINAFSVPGEGTEFRIYLPRIQMQERVRDQKNASEIATGTETVLLVEDDEMLRRATKRTLESLGYRVDEAALPSEALELLSERDEHYDLLLTDVVMPGMNGAQLRDRVVGLRPGIKVLFMSGYTTDAIVCGEVLQDGIDFIQKPFNVEAFAEKIREVLDRRGS
jgi:PAS domain S-box-containing protein